MKPDFIKTFENELKFIKKIKDEDIKKKILVAFLNYPNQFKVLLHILPDLLKNGTITFKGFLHQFYENPEGILKTFNIDYENKSFSITEHDCTNCKYNHDI